MGAFDVLTLKGSSKTFGTPKVFRNLKCRRILLFSKIEDSKRFCHSQWGRGNKVGGDGIVQNLLVLQEIFISHCQKKS